MKRITVLLGVVFAIGACSSDKKDTPGPAKTTPPAAKSTDQKPADPTPTQGLAVTRVDKPSTKSFGDTVTALETSLKSKGFMIVGKVDHRNMLSMLGVDIGGATTLEFGKPDMGKMLLPMMPAAGLEMPGKIYVYEAAGAVTVSFSRPSVGFAAYGDPKLAEMGAMMDDAFDAVTSEASGAAPVGPAATVAARPADARVDKPSARGFGDTVSKLDTTLKENGFMVVNKIDHRNMLSMLGVDIGGATTLEFGKPDMGKMLLPMAPAAGLEMPGKIYVYEAAGAVTVSYVLPSVGFAAYGDPKLAEMGAMMDGALDNITSAATK